MRQKELPTKKSTKLKPLGETCRVPLLVGGIMGPRDMISTDIVNTFNHPNVPNDGRITA